MTQLWNWFAMGGYAYYVWPAYGLVSAVLLLNLIGMKRKKKQTKQHLQQWFKR